MMGDNKFQAAFRVAQNANTIATGELDLMIIDQIYTVCDHINNIPGFNAQVDSVFEHVSEHANKLSFRFSVFYNNMKADFTLDADKGKYRGNDPKFFIRSGWLGESKEIRLKNESDIDDVLLTIARTLGESTAEARRSQNLSDALARRRLMGTMPEIKLDKI